MAHSPATDFVNRLHEDPWSVLNESLESIKEITEGSKRSKLTIGQRRQTSDLRLRIESALDVILPYATGGWTRLESYIPNDDLLPIFLGAQAKDMDMRSYIVAAALAAAQEDSTGGGMDRDLVIDEALADLAGVK